MLPQSNPYRYGVPPISKDAVHVWSARLREHVGRLPSLADTLSSEEHERAARFHFERDRLRYVVARGLLREMLGHYTRRNPDSITFSYGPCRKPALAYQDPQQPLFFNISHSGEWVLLAFSRSSEIGVDVEGIGRGEISDSLTERCLSPEEHLEWKRLDRSRRHAAFFKLWVRKEAYMKGLGLGLALAPSSISVSLGRAQLLPGRRDHQGRQTLRWRLFELAADDGSEAALAIEGAASCTRILHHRWDPCT